MKRWNQAIALVLCAAILSMNVPWVAVVATANEIDSTQIASEVDESTQQEGSGTTVLDESDFDTVLDSGSSGTVNDLNETLSLDGGTLDDSADLNTVLGEDSLNETQVDTVLESDGSDTESGVSKTSLEDEEDPVAETASEETTTSTALISYELISGSMISQSIAQGLDTYEEIYAAIYFKIKFYDELVYSGANPSSVVSGASSSVNADTGVVTITLTYDLFWRLRGASTTSEILPSGVTEIKDSDDNVTAYSFTVTPALYYFDETEVQSNDNGSWLTFSECEKYDWLNEDWTYFVGNMSNSFLAEVSSYQSTTDSTDLEAYIATKETLTAADIDDPGNALLSSDPNYGEQFVLAIYVELTSSLLTSTNVTKMITTLRYTGDSPSETMTVGFDGAAQYYSSEGEDTADFVMTYDSSFGTTVTATVYYLWREDGETVPYNVAIGSSASDLEGKIDYGPYYGDYFVNVDNEQYSRAHISNDTTFSCGGFTGMTYVTGTYSSTDNGTSEDGNTSYWTATESTTYLAQDGTYVYYEYTEKVDAGGYSFSSSVYYYDDNTDKVVIGTAADLELVVVDLLGTSKSYTLPSLDAFTGDLSNVTSTISFDSSVVTSSAQTEGFTFLGWDYNYFISINSTIATQDYIIIAVAVMSRNSYDITYALGEGETFSNEVLTDSGLTAGAITSTTTPYTASYAFEAAVDLNDVVPTKTGYIFTGWEITNTEDKTITYLTNEDGTLSETVFSMPASDGLVLTATWVPYDLNIYYAIANAGDVLSAENYTLFTTTDEDAVEHTTFSLTFDAQTGAILLPEGLEAAITNLADGASIQLDDYFLDAAGSVSTKNITTYDAYWTSYAALDGSNEASAGMNLYIVYYKTYSVSYQLSDAAYDATFSQSIIADTEHYTSDSEAGTATYTVGEYTTGEVVEITNMPIPTCDGYLFTGWVVQSDTDTAIKITDTDWWDADSRTITMPSEDVVFVATWILMPPDTGLALDLAPVLMLFLLVALAGGTKVYMQHKQNLIERGDEQ